jgi:outer membrane murein-binding lipoprotein Lpp
LISSAEQSKINKNFFKGNKMFKVILSIVSLALLPGCATQSKVDEKFAEIKVELTDLSSRTDALSRKEAADMVNMNEKIHLLTAKTDSSFADIKATNRFIEDVNAKLTSLNRKTDAISRKLFPAHAHKKSPRKQDKTKVKKN